MDKKITTKTIESKILTIRNQQVMIDRDLAELYGVETKRLNEQVKRNIERFPDDFMFQLSDEEFSVLRSQFATSKTETRKHCIISAHRSKIWAKNALPLKCWMPR